MSNTTISPSMNLPVPDVGLEPGPAWATDLNSCLSIIDGHNHTTGQGVPITPNGININADLPMNGNNLITVRSANFDAQSAPLNLPADLGCIYVSGVDLYYNDKSGNQIRMTQSGAPAGATGTITGLPSGTASASFSGSTFTFQSATNTPATMNIGPIILGQPVASGFNITISPSVSQASNYALTMPLTLPSTNSYLQSDASGNLTFVQNYSAKVLTTTNADYTMLTTDGYQTFIFSCGSSNRAFNLAAAASSTNRLCFIERTDSVTSAGAGVLTVTGNGAELIGGANTLPLYSAGDRAILVCNGTSWNILSLLSTEYGYNSSSSTTTSDTTSFAYGIGGAQIQNITAGLNRRIRWLSAPSASDLITPEILVSGAVAWISPALSPADTSINAWITPWIVQGGGEYGYGRPVQVNSTDFDIRFGVYCYASNASYGGSGQAWGSGSPAAGAAFWRIKKVRMISG